MWPVNVHELFKLIVFRDFYAIRQYGVMNHNAGDRSACLGILVNTLKNKVGEERMQSLQWFWDQHHETETKIAKQAIWSAEFYDVYLKGLANSDSIESYELWEVNYSKECKEKRDAEKLQYLPDSLLPKFDTDKDFLDSLKAIENE